MGLPLLSFGWCVMNVEDSGQGGYIHDGLMKNRDSLCFCNSETWVCCRRKMERELWGMSTLRNCHSHRRRLDGVCRGDGFSWLLMMLIARKGRLRLCGLSFPVPGRQGRGLLNVENEEDLCKITHCYCSILPMWTRVMMKTIMQAAINDRIEIRNRNATAGQQ